MGGRPQAVDTWDVRAMGPQGVREVEPLCTQDVGATGPQGAQKAGRGLALVAAQAGWLQGLVRQSYGAACSVRPRGCRVHQWQGPCGG